MNCFLEILKTMAEIQCLQLALEKLVELHKLIANNEGESIETDLIRDELYDYHKLLPHEIVDWLREFSDRLYSLVNKELI